MSGGSYNYLCHRDATGLLESLGQIEAMADRLSELGFADAARETHEVRLTVLQSRARLDAMIDRLRDVWHAVEWLDSCDWGLDAVLRYVHAYRGSPPCEHAERSEWRPVSWPERHADGGCTWHSGRYRYCLACGDEEREETKP